MVGESARPCWGVVTVRELFATAFGGIPVLARPWPGTLAEAWALDRGIAHLATAHRACGTAPDGPGRDTAVAQCSRVQGVRGSSWGRPVDRSGRPMRGRAGTAVLVGASWRTPRANWLGRGAAAVAAECKTTSPACDGSAHRRPRPTPSPTRRPTARTSISREAAGACRAGSTDVPGRHHTHRPGHRHRRVPRHRR